ncbi:MAG: SRPBCC family protein [Pseudomonadota bacterium]
MQPVFILSDIALDAPASDVWDIVGDFCSDILGEGFVLKIEGEGNFQGALRTLHLHPDYGGGTVVERQVVRDDRGYYYSYELADPGPMPFKDYYGSAHVVPNSEATCRVIWTNRYRAPSELREPMMQQSKLLLVKIEESLRKALA